MNYSLNQNELDFDIHAVTLSDTFDLSTELVEITGIKKFYQNQYDHTEGKAHKVLVFEFTGYLWLNKIQHNWGMAHFGRTQVKIQISLKH